MIFEHFHRLCLLNNNQSINQQQQQFNFSMFNANLQPIDTTTPTLCQQLPQQPHSNHPTSITSTHTHHWQKNKLYSYLTHDNTNCASDKCALITSWRPQCRNNANNHNVPATRATGADVALTAVGIKINFVYLIKK